MKLPAGFPSPVEAVACDLDRTLIGDDAVLGERTIETIRRVRAAGVPFVVVTGRMFRSVRPYLEQAGIDDPVVCYQGAGVFDPRTGELLRHEPMPLELAREALAALAGRHVNAYVGDQLYVAEVNEHARAYAEFQRIPVTPVGDLRSWLAEPPTKLVVVGDPAELTGLRERLRARFGDAMYVSTSLPFFLELAAAGVSKGAGLQFVAEALGFARGRTIAFGDGENDVELLEWAGFGIAVADAHPRLKAVADWTCPGPKELGVAQVLEALLDSAS